MTDEQMRKLVALQNYGTRYEAVVIRGDGERRLLAYCGRHSRRGLIDALQNRAEIAIKFLGIGADARMTLAKDAISLTGGGMVKFTGRTQRDAIMSGELPYIAA